MVSRQWAAGAENNGPTLGSHKIRVQTCKVAKQWTNIRVTQKQATDMQSCKLWLSSCLMFLIQLSHCFNKQQQARTQTLVRVQRVPCTFSSETRKQGSINLFQEGLLSLQDLVRCVFTRDQMTRAKIRTNSIHPIPKVPYLTAHRWKLSPLPSQTAKTETGQ